MSRQVSVGMMKDTTRSVIRKSPKEVTRRRALYDLLTSNAGKWIYLSEIRALGYTKSNVIGSAFAWLRDDYGFDIRCGYGKWILAGEYVGLGYIDYIANPELVRKGPADAKVEAHINAVL